MKEHSILVNFLISLEQIDQFQVHKILDIMNYYHIDTLVLHGDIFDFQSDRYFDLIKLLDTFQISYLSPDSKEHEYMKREAFMLYDEHQSNLVEYCNKSGIKCEFQFAMNEFESVMDQDYLWDTMNENELDYVLLEHEDQYQLFFSNIFLKKLLESRFEVIVPLEQVNISDQIVEECGYMSHPIKIADKVLLITELVTKENLQWIEKEINANLEGCNYVLVDYMEAGENGLCKEDCDQLFHMIDQYKIDKIIYQNGIQLDSFISDLKRQYPTFPLKKMEFQYEQNMRQQEMVE